MPNKRTANSDQGPGPSGAGPLTDRWRITARLWTWGPLGALMLIGLWFRLTVTMWTPIIHPDSMQYMRLAQEVRSGEFFRRGYSLEEGFIKSRRLPPLYSFLIAPFAQTQADLEKVGITISLTLSTLAFIPFYLAARRAFSEGAALVAAGLFTFNNFAIWWAYPILTEPLFTFLFVATLFASVEAVVRDRLGWFVLAGVLSALLYMTRDVGITAAPLVMAAAVAKLRMIDRGTWRRAAIAAGAAGLAFMIAASPYFLHIRVRTGQWGLTAQMDKTSITRQIKAVGGTRWDRDQITGERISYLGGDRDQSVLGLVKVAPALAGKVLRNLNLYGKELIKRMNGFTLAPLIIGLAFIVLDYRASRDRPRLLLQAMVVVWAAQLWALYSLITPYMVDERYMYPLSPIILMIAGHGIWSAAKWAVQGPGVPDGPGKANPWVGAISIIVNLVLGVGIGWAASEFNWVPRNPGMVLFGLGLALAGWLIGWAARGRSSRPALLFTFPAAAALFFMIQPFLVHSGVVSYFHRAQISSANILFYAYAGALAISFLALVPAAWMARNSRFLSGSIEVRYVIGAVLALASLTTVFLLGAGGWAQAPLTLAAGFGLALLVPAGTTPDGRSRAWPAPVISLFLVAAAFVSRTPDYMDLRDRIGNVASKFTAGHKEAAKEIKARGLVPAGKMFVSRKPFLAYYLDGFWYLDKEKNEPMPQEIGPLMELLGSGEADYLVADSFTLKHLRIQLSFLAYGTRTIPGASLIYSQYFPQYERIITVYDLRAPEPPPRSGAPAEHLARAEEYQRQGNLPLAMRELDAALDQDPGSQRAWSMKLSLLTIYYNLANVRENPTLIFFPELLPALAQAAQKYYELSPDDAWAEQTYRRTLELYQHESQEVERRKAEIRRRNRPPETGPGE